MRRRHARAGSLVAPLALAALLAVALGLVQPFRIPSASMSATLLPGDYVLVDKTAYGVRVPFTTARLFAWRGPARGEVVVFRFSRDERRDWVKRCIAVAGETLEIRDKHVVVDGDTLVEPYALHSDAAVRPGGRDFRDNFGPVTIGPGRVFVMGDNRDDSDDSRFHGTVPVDRVAGRPLLVYWSWDEPRGRPRWERVFRWVD